jgi:predicted ATPase
MLDLKGQLKIVLWRGSEQDSIHINLQNPASFANLKMTTFALGGTYNTTLKSDTKSENATRTTLDYLAVGLPLVK